MSARENLDSELTSYSLDDEDQLQPEDTLVTDRGEDVLDAGYSPPDSARGSLAHGTTATELGRSETIEQRIRQEEADPTSAYGAPDNESGLDDPRVGGDDPDSIDAQDDWLGDREVGSVRAGRLVAPDEGTHADVDDEAWGRDVGIDGGAASAEEAAVHIIEDEDFS